MTATTDLQAAYESLQLHLDAHPDDQDARRVLADVLEDMGRQAAAECVRWLAENDVRPDYDAGLWWFTTRRNRKNGKRCWLPHVIFVRLRQLVVHWWRYFSSRRLAEEAALRAWEEWRRENPTGEPK